MSTILCVEGEPSLAALLESTLQEIGHDAVLTSSVQAAIQALGRQPVDLIISEYRMHDASGLDLLDHLRREGQDIPVIVLSARPSIEHAVASMRHGAVDYLTKPLRFEALRGAIDHAMEICRLRRDGVSGGRENEPFGRSRVIVGESPALRRVMEAIASVAPTRASVLLEGESGTGKELFARAIHEQSGRRERPFVTLNCAALPEGLVESALFGHERGAFTGAASRLAGAFERADGGTLHLDEISELRLDLQPKLLRAIQEQEFERVGGDRPVRVDVRVIATSNRGLLSEVEAGRFRADLFYRLSVFPIHTPPLRQRPDDIPLLVRHFAEGAARELGTSPPEVPDETLEHLLRRPWPGNVRELSNAVYRAVILCRNGRLDVRSFSPPSWGEVESPPAFAGSSTEKGRGEVHDLEDVLNLDLLEQRAIERALRVTRGHRTRAAQLLGISERTLRNKLNVRTVPAA